MLPGSYGPHRSLCPQRPRQVVARCVDVARHLMQRWFFLELERHGGLQAAGQIQHPTLHQTAGDPLGGALERDRGLPVGRLEKYPHVVPYLEMAVRRDFRKRHGQFSTHLLVVVAFQPCHGGFIGEGRRKPRGQHRIRPRRADQRLCPPAPPPLRAPRTSPPPPPPPPLPSPPPPPPIPTRASLGSCGSPLATSAPPARARDKMFAGPYGPAESQTEIGRASCR